MKKLLLLPSVLLSCGLFGQQSTFPGGISNNLQIWVKADIGTGTSTDGAQVPVWTNQKPGGVNGIANQGIPGLYSDPGAARRPIYRAAASIPNFNFNPAIEIVSTDGFRSGYKFPSGFPNNATNALTSYTHLTRTNSAAYRTVFVMNGTTASSNTTNIAGVYQAPFFGTHNNRPGFYNEKESGDVYFGTGSLTLGNTPTIQSYYNSTVGGAMKYFFDNNGLSFGQPSNGISSLYNYSGMVLLMENDGGAGSASLAGDRIGEFILYSGTQTPEERQRVNSYLATKYGITLQQPQNYLSSNQLVTWNSSVNTSFNNNIFGLASDIEKSALDQKVSNSINWGNNIMLVASTTNDFVSPNNAPGRVSFSQDETFLLLGDNNVQTLSLTNFGITPGRRVQRAWLAQRTNNSGNVWLQADFSRYTSIANSDKMFMIVADNATFTQNVEFVSATSYVGKKAVFNYSFPSNKYITFGVNLQNHCTKNPATGTPDNYTKIGITTQTKQNAWPENIPNGFFALESKEKGLVISRVSNSTMIADPKEGMIIYDIQDKCVKLYNGSIWKCVTKGCNE